MKIVNAICPDCQYTDQILENQMQKQMICKKCSKRTILNPVHAKTNNDSTQFLSRSMAAHPKNNINNSNNDRLKQLRLEDMAILKYISILKLANKNQIQKGLSIFLKQADENNPKSLIQIFSGAGILRDSDIDFIKRLQLFFSIKEQDRKWAHLAIKNKLLTSKQIDMAFEKQVNLFKHSKKVKSISEFLVMSNVLRQEYCDALKCRLNISFPKKEKSLFGSIAITEGIINHKQLNKILSIQDIEFKRTQKIRLLGSILLDHKLISKKQRNRVLKHQKKIKEKDVFEQKWNISLENISPFFQYQELKSLLSPIG